MTAWTSKTVEEQALLGPSLTAILLWSAARGYARDSPPHGQRGLPFELAFVVLPVVLDKDTREALPTQIRTSLATWLTTVPLAGARMAVRARVLLPFTREALVFGGAHRLLAIEDGVIVASAEQARSIERVLADTSDEVRDCVKRAEFVGRWFARAGAPMTVLALLGVHP